MDRDDILFEILVEVLKTKSIFPRYAIVCLTLKCMDVSRWRQDEIIFGEIVNYKSLFA